MELEQMSSAELISLVRRQEQELSAARAAQQGGAPDPEWPAGEQEAWRLGYQAAQQGGGELPQDERAVNVKEIHAAVLAMRCDPKMTDAQRFAFTGAVHMAAAVVSQFAQRAASVPAQAE